MARLDDTITYLEMHARPAGKRVPQPLEKLALMWAEGITVSFYRYLYNAVGEPWLWFERRQLADDALAAGIAGPGIEIFVLYVRGVPAGYFELDVSDQRETKLCYFGLMPDFIGRGLGPYLLQAAVDRAWSRPIERFWLHTSTYDHPKALRVYQRGGFSVYQRTPVTFEDPRPRGLVSRDHPHSRLPSLEGR